MTSIQTVKLMLKSPLALWHGHIIFEKKTSILTKHFKIHFFKAQLSAPVYMQCMTYSDLQHILLSGNVVFCIMKKISLDDISIVQHETFEALTSFVLFDWSGNQIQ